MDIREKMKKRKLYYSNDEKLMKEQLECLNLLYDFNMTRPSEMEKRMILMKKLLAEVGNNCYIEPPLHANWGKNTHLGNDVYANFNLTLVDDTDIYIGNNVLIGPNVIIDTGTHPVKPDIRKKQAQFNVPVYIGDNVWIGGGSIILPGVKVGKNSAYWCWKCSYKRYPRKCSSCRKIHVGILREIGEKDLKYYYKDLEIDID